MHTSENTSNGSMNINGENPYLPLPSIYDDIPSKDGGNYGILYYM
jgi:hypothetical protein